MGFGRPDTWVKVDVALALAVKVRERLLQGFAPATCEWRACQVVGYVTDATCLSYRLHCSGGDYTTLSLAPQAEHSDEEDCGSGASAALM
jgi:hypothetical protein